MSVKHPTALVPLVNGFEEIELVAVVDVLRRAGVAVTVACAGEGEGLWRTGSHDISVKADEPWEQAAARDHDAVVLPGGPGVKALFDVPGLLAKLTAQHRRGGVVAAVCAAPSVLARAGLLAGAPATCHPSVNDQLMAAGAVLAPGAVVRHGAILTSRGPGTSVAFALALVAVLVGQTKADELAQAMQVTGYR